MPRSDFDRDCAIIINREHMVLARLPKAAEPPSWSQTTIWWIAKVGAGVQCEGCRRDVLDVLRYWPELDAFECCECGRSYPVVLDDLADVDDPSKCQGHPPGPFDPMGETVYCDGSCTGRRRD